MNLSKKHREIGTYCQNQGILRPCQEYSGNLFVGYAAVVVKRACKYLILYHDDPNVALEKDYLGFIDYIHMGKINGEWKIYNVVCEPNYN